MNPSSKNSNFTHSLSSKDFILNKFNEKKLHRIPTER